MSGYEVGHKRPPKHSQFKKGKSGNPHGRPKHSAEFSSIVRKELETTVTVQENGKPRKVTKLAALTKKTIADAFNNDRFARKEVLRWIETAPEPEEPSPGASCSDLDLEIIRKFAPLYLNSGEDTQ